MYYIFNSEGNCIATADSEVNNEDLASRREFAVQSENVIPLERAILENGSVVEKTVEL